MSAAWVTALCALLTLAGILLAWGGRNAWRVVSRIVRFLDDYSGDPGVPGVRPARPGVMQRLSGLEDGMRDIRDQVHLNSGHSMRDTVQRTEAAVADLQVSVNGLGDRMDNMAGGKP